MDTTLCPRDFQLQAFALRWKAKVKRKTYEPNFMLHLCNLYFFFTQSGAGVP